MTSWKEQRRQRLNENINKLITEQEEAIRQDIKGEISKKVIAIMIYLNQRILDDNLRIEIGNKIIEIFWDE